MIQSPTALVIGGPNGAGKSTLATILNEPGIFFLNADEIAKSLPAHLAHRDVHAGRLFLENLDRLVAERVDFAIETTLASRSLAPRIRQLKVIGYELTLAYVWIPSPDLAVKRVASRVRKG